MNKEQVLLGVVVALTAGVWALDERYAPVSVPSTYAPEETPRVPSFGGLQTVPDPGAGGRSMFDEYTDLRFPPIADLPSLPAPPVPLAIVPVRPFPHLDVADGLRHYFPDPQMPEDEFAGDPVDDGSDPGSVTEDGADPFDLLEGRGDESEEVALDLTTFDWVVIKGLENKAWGRLSLLPGSQARDKYDLLVDPELDFVWQQINPKSGKVMSTVRGFRDRVVRLGFADTIENVYRSEERVREKGTRLKEAAGWKDLARWTREKALSGEYDRFEGLGYAAGALREALRRSADDKDTVKRLGALHRLAQDLEAELALYDWWLARQEIAKDPEILALRGRVLEALGLEERARQDYEQVLVTLPDGEVRARLAELLLRTGSVEDARLAADHFRRATQDGARAVGAVGEARAVLATGDIAATATLLERVPQPDRRGWWYLTRGAVLYAQGDLTGARDHFTAAREKAVEDLETLERGTLSHERAAWAVPVARTNEAVAAARAGAAIADPEDPARVALLDEALALADQALIDDPFNYYWPLVARGYALRAKGDFEGSVEALQEAVAAQPDEPYGRYLLGEFLLRDGRRTEARTQFLRAARLAPGFPDGPAGVGRAGGGEAGEGSDFLRRAIELEPGFTLWRLLTARTILDDDQLPLNQRLEEARRELRTLLDDVDRNDPLAQAQLGWVRYRQLDADEALTRWNAAQRLISPVQPGTPAEDLYKWLEAARKAVDDWMNTRIWSDEFERTDGNTVGNGWTEVEKQGVKLRLDGGAVQFGPGRHVAGEEPAVYRDKPVKEVRSAEIEIVVAPSEPVDVTIEFFTPQGSRKGAVIGLKKKENGQVVLIWDPTGREKNPERALEGFAWPEDGRVAFGVRILDPETGRVEALIDGRPVPGLAAEEFRGLAGSRGSFRMQVACQAAGGTEYKVRVERAEQWLDMRK